MTQNSDSAPLNTEVECRYAFDWRWDKPFGRGRVVAVSDAPMFLIESENGRKAWWRVDLTREVSDELGDEANFEFLDPEDRG